MMKKMKMWLVNYADINLLARKKIKRINKKIIKTEIGCFQKS